MATQGVASAAASSSAAPLRQYPGSAGAIVYLTQGARHSSYGQTTMQQLRKSVALLYEHYNRKQRDDVHVASQEPLWGDQDGGVPYPPLSGGGVWHTWLDMRGRGRGCVSWV